jgi:hypothetical protein
LLDDCPELEALALCEFLNHHFSQQQPVILVKSTFGFFSKASL